MATIKELFIDEMNSFITEAEFNLAKLGFDRNIWKKEISSFTFDIGIYQVTSKVSKESNERFKLNSSVASEQANGIQAMWWARVAGFSHLAKKTKNPMESFALGYSLRQIKFDLNQKKFADVINRRRSEKGGRNRKGKFGSFSLLVHELLRINPKFRFEDLLREIRKEPDSKTLDGPMEKAAIIKIKIDRDTQVIEYEEHINGISQTKNIKFSSARNKFSINKK